LDLGKIVRVLNGFVVFQFDVWTWQVAWWWWKLVSVGSVLLKGTQLKLVLS